MNKYLDHTAPYKDMRFISLQLNVVGISNNMEEKELSIDMEMKFVEHIFCG